MLRLVIPLRDADIEGLDEPVAVAVTRQRPIERIANSGRHLPQPLLVSRGVVDRRDARDILPVGVEEVVLVPLRLPGAHRPQLTGAVNRVVLVDDEPHEVLQGVEVARVASGLQRHRVLRVPPRLIRPHPADIGVTHPDVAVDHGRAENVVEHGRQRVRLDAGLRRNLGDTVVVAVRRAPREGVLRAVAVTRGDADRTESLRLEHRQRQVLPARVREFVRNGEVKSQRPRALRVGVAREDHALVGVGVDRNAQHRFVGLVDEVHIRAVDRVLRVAEPAPGGVLRQRLSRQEPIRLAVLIEEHQAAAVLSTLHDVEGILTQRKPEKALVGERCRGREGAVDGECDGVPHNLEGPRLLDAVAVGDAGDHGTVRRHLDDGRCGEFTRADHDRLGDVELGERGDLRHSGAVRASVIEVNSELRGRDLIEAHVVRGVPDRHRRTELRARNRAPRRTVPRFDPIARRRLDRPRIGEEVNGETIKLPHRRQIDLDPIGRIRRAVRRPPIPRILGVRHNPVNHLGHRIVRERVGRSGRTRAH